MEEQVEERVFEGVPNGLNEEVKIAYYSSTIEVMIDNATFVFVGQLNDNKSPRLVSTWVTPGGSLAILIFEIGEDNAYRWKADICVDENYDLILEKKLKNGDERRADLKIVY